LLDIREVLLDFVGRSVTKVDNSSHIIELDRDARYVIDFRHHRQFFILVSTEHLKIYQDMKYYGIILIARNKYTGEIEDTIEALVSGKNIVVSDRVNQDLISIFEKDGDLIRLDEFETEDKTRRHLQKAFFDRWLDNREGWNRCLEEYKKIKPSLKYSDGKLSFKIE
jgi:hypothetical protein